jgi:hypothetical protein
MVMLRFGVNLLIYNMSWLPARIFVAAGVMFTDNGLGPFGEVRGDVTVVDLVGEEEGEVLSFNGSLNRERALSPREVRGFSTLESVSFLSLDLSCVDFFTANAIGDSTMNHCCQLQQDEEYIHTEYPCA